MTLGSEVGIRRVASQQHGDGKRSNFREVLWNDRGLGGEENLRRQAFFAFSSFLFLVILPGNLTLGNGRDMQLSSTLSLMEKMSNRGRAAYLDPIILGDICLV